MNLRKKFNIFCFKNRNKGISNLMLYIALGNAIVYLLSYVMNTTFLYDILSFDRELILQGQVWRLVTYAFTYYSGNLLYTALILYVLYSLGRAAELSVGAFRFNLYYFCGIILQDIFCMIYGTPATINDLNYTMLMVFASQHPDFKVHLYFIIPIKAWILVVVNLVITAYNVFALRAFFPHNLFPLIAILNFLLFFGDDFINIFKPMRRAKSAKSFQKKMPSQTGTIPFSKEPDFKPLPVKEEHYTHRCTVCGRTDVSHPDLEFRYCSRCQGYHCYCEEHIGNHTHIE